MLWELSGYAMSIPTIHRLFKLTAVSDKENTKKFTFGQATALAEHIIRITFHVSTDKVSPYTAMAFLKKFGQFAHNGAFLFKSLFFNSSGFEIQSIIASTFR